jgi:hypothetical protein
MVYAAKKDRWLIGVVLSCSLVLIGVGIAGPLFWLLGGVARGIWPVPVSLLAGLIGVLLPWLVFTISYEITTTELVLRMGPFRWRIQLSAIEEVCLVSGSMLVLGWKLAPSLDRLLIRYRTRKGGLGFGVVISPLDREGFVRKLSEAVPPLKVTGNLLTA